jgi:DNA-binding transcriptional LysR family regulator
MPVTTVSGKIPALEKQLGATLLHRTTRKLHVTQAGSAYFKHRVLALEEMSAGEKKILTARLRPEGLLRLTAPPDLGHRGRSRHRRRAAPGFEPGRPKCQESRSVSLGYRRLPPQTRRAAPSEGVDRASSHRGRVSGCARRSSVGRKSLRTRSHACCQSGAPFRQRPGPAVSGIPPAKLSRYEPVSRRPNRLPFTTSRVSVTAHETSRLEGAVQSIRVIT